MKATRLRSVKPLLYGQKLLQMFEINTTQTLSRNKEGNSKLCTLISINISFILINNINIGYLCLNFLVCYIIFLIFRDI